MKNLGKIIILIILSIFSFSENVFKIESKGIINGIIERGVWWKRKRIY